MCRMRPGHFLGFGLLTLRRPAFVERQALRQDPIATASKTPTSREKWFSR